MIETMQGIFFVSSKLYDKIYANKLGINFAKVLFIVFVLLLFVFGETYSDEMQNTIPFVLMNIIVTLLLLILVLVQLISVAHEKMIDSEFSRSHYSFKHYFIYCANNILCLFVLFSWLFVLLRNNIFTFMVHNINILLMIIVFIISILTFLWFGFIISFNVGGLQWIKTKLNKYIAVISTVNLLHYLIDVKQLVITAAVILVVYRWIAYIIEEKKLIEEKGLTTASN